MGTHWLVSDVTSVMEDVSKFSKLVSRTLVIVAETPTAAPSDFAQYPEELIIKKVASMHPIWLTAKGLGNSLWTGSGEQVSNYNQPPFKFYFRINELINQV